MKICSKNIKNNTWVLKELRSFPSLLTPSDIFINRQHKSRNHPIYNVESTTDWVSKVERLEVNRMNQKHLYHVKCPYCEFEADTSNTTIFWIHFKKVHGYSREEYLEFLRDIYYPSLNDSNYPSGYCEICGAKTPFQKFYIGFSHCCSRKCGLIWSYQQQDPGKIKAKMERIADTIEKRYGVRNAFQSEALMEKSKQTCLERYGVEYASQSEEVKRKVVETNLERYGVPYSQYLDSVKERVIVTCMERYGTPHTTKQATYGNRKNFRDTPYKSKQEQKVYEILTERYQTVYTQYKDEDRYPFKCDFYILDIDTFLEINGFWTHGGHPFDPNSYEDMNKLKIWTERAVDSDMFQEAINTWTIRDVRKRNIAKQNNLNYVEIFHWKNKQDFLNQLDSAINGRSANV